MDADEYLLTRKIKPGDTTASVMEDYHQAKSKEESLPSSEGYMAIRSILRSFIRWQLQEDMIDYLTIDYEMAETYLEQSHHPLPISEETCNCKRPVVGPPKPDMIGKIVKCGGCRKPLKDKFQLKEKPPVRMKEMKFHRFRNIKTESVSYFNEPITVSKFMSINRTQQQLLGLIPTIHNNT